ncbi:MAG: DNA polymerase III subunit delta [Cytophagales bacterium]|nr:DNA polymerase III subunit delta [Bernardetiaceae bacterium]MDW8210373.1 DNA polymerase III subunit delta [Cytophagales bacterium]
MRFRDIAGYQSLKKTLVSAVQSGRVPHAQLWLGNEGSPNLTLALAYATFLNCQQPTDDSCGTCPACYKYDRFIHPDLHFVFPTATTKQITKREEAVSAAFLKPWRQFLKQKPYGNLADWANELGAENKQCIIPVQEGRNIIKALSLKSFEASYKVMLIWLPELMNVSAANAILKILEEPPERTVFLLVAQQIEQVLPTILSRTQLIHVRPFTDEELREMLVQHYRVPQQKAVEVVPLANGNLREALSLVETVEHTSAEKFRQWMLNCFKMDIKALIKESEQFGNLDREMQKAFLQYGISILRETLTIQVLGENQARLQAGALNFVRNFSKFINYHNIDLLYQLFSRTIYEIERNANPRMAFMSLSLKVGQILKSQQQAYRTGQNV